MKMTKETRDWIVRIVQVALLTILTTYAGSAKRSTGDLEMTVQHMARIQSEMLEVMLRNNVPVAGPDRGP